MLKWVQKHIHQFGGNKDLVTIMGHDAGNYKYVEKVFKNCFETRVTESTQVIIIIFKQGGYNSEN